MSLQLHKPDGRGGLEPRTVSEGTWRRQLRSPGSFSSSDRAVECQLAAPGQIVRSRGAVAAVRCTLAM